MNGSDTRQLKTLEEINATEVLHSTFLIIYLCLIALTGVPGNMFVCFTYRQRATKSMSRYFIFWLGVTDTVGCGSILLELLTVCMPYVYPDEWLCKVTIHLEMGTVMMSAGLLTVISIDRYRRVCHPHSKQIMKRHAGKIVIALCVSSNIFSVPVWVFYGIREYEFENMNGIGHGCDVRNNFDENILFKVYGSFHGVCFTVSFVMMVVIYILIGKQICKRYGANPGKMSEPNEETSAVASTSPHTSDSQHKGKISIVGKMSSIGQSVPRNRIQRSDGVHNKLRSSVLSMFLITLIFVVSFVPYMTLRAIQSTRYDYVSSLTDVERAVFKFFLRLYFLNCSVNPFIYGACLPRFRKDIQLYWNRLCNRQW